MRSTFLPDAIRSRNVLARGLLHEDSRMEHDLAWTSMDLN